MNFLVTLGDKLINHGLRSEIPRLNCVLEVGQKRTGKSSLFVPVADYFRSIDYRVFCNFPIQDCYSIPLIKKYNKKAGKEVWTIDKEWLYDTDLTKSLVLIDEAEQVWGARDYMTWTADDQNWFTELGKNDTVVYMVTQYFDLIDINCKRSCDAQIFLTRSTFFKNISFLDFSELASLPVRDKMEVIDIKGARGFVHETWTVCAKHYRNCRFYRKPFYSKFNTKFSMKKKIPLDLNNCIAWNDVYDFDSDKPLSADVQLNDLSDSPAVSERQ